MAAKGRRGSSTPLNRRKAASARGVARAAGVLVSPRIAHLKATRLQQVNAPNILSFKKRRAAVSAGRIHGLSIINGVGSRRSTMGSRPSGHGINAPKGRY
jgi:hypothetical protein